MDDGNMGTGGQVPAIAPVPTEEDMSKVKAIFEQALNAIVGMSQLQKTVETLQAQVNDTASTLTKLRQQNDWLEESLNRARHDRDNALAEAKTAKFEANQAKQECDATIVDNRELQQRVDTQIQEIMKLKAERDDYGLQVMDLEDQVKSLQTKLDQIHEGYKNIFGDEPKAMPSEPNPYPTPAEMHQPASKPEPVKDDFAKHWPEEPHTPTPTKTYLDRWEQGSKWDDETHRYYRE